MLYGQNPDKWYQAQQKHPSFWDAYKNLATLDATKFDTTCVPRPNHFVAMATLSRTLSSKACHGDGCDFQNAHREGAADTSEHFETYLTSLADASQFNSNSQCKSDHNNFQEGDKHYDLHCCYECYGGGGKDRQPWCNEADNWCMTGDQSANNAECCPSHNYNFVSATTATTASTAAFQYTHLFVVVVVVVVLLSLLLFPLLSSLLQEPTPLKQRFKEGSVSMLFGNRLFQQGCLNNNCKFAVEPCTAVGIKAADLNAQVGALEDATNKLITKVETLSSGDVKSWNNLTQAFFEVSVESQSQGYDSAISLYESMVTLSEQNVTVPGMEDYCPHDHWDHINQKENTQWQSDPCCNWALRETMCCAPKSRTQIEMVVTGVNMDVVRECYDCYNCYDCRFPVYSPLCCCCCCCCCCCSSFTSSFSSSFLSPSGTYCRNPAKVEKMLNDVQTQVSKAQECSRSMDKDLGKAALESLWTFNDKCKDQVGLREHADLAECKKDADCACSYQKCNTADGKCEIPYAKLGECFAQCFKGMADKKVVDYLKQDWVSEFMVHVDHVDTILLITFSTRCITWEALLIQEYFVLFH